MLISVHLQFYSSTAVYSIEIIVQKDAERVILIL